MRTRPETFDERRVLGLRKDAGWTEIQAAYRKLALALHPDLKSGVDREKASEEFRCITEAYESLRRRHAEERLRTKKHIEHICADPAVIVLPIEEIELRLRHSSSPQVRAASALLLGRRLDARSRVLLLEAVRDSESQVRLAAIDSLRRVGTRWDVIRGQARDRLMRLGGYTSNER